MTSVEFFYDYGSPYSYLADTRLAGLEARTGARVVYRPMLLGGVFKATGNESPFVEPVEAKRKYFSTELRRAVVALGVTFEQNSHFPINTLGLMRAAYAARALDVFESFHSTIYPSAVNDVSVNFNAAGCSCLTSRFPMLPKIPSEIPMSKIPPPT